MATMGPGNAALKAESDEAAATVRAFCEPLPSVDQVDDFGEAFDRFGDARVVLLGEATHGTSEFHRARAAITRRLIEKHGFNIIAVEADWPDAARIDRHVRHRAFRPGCGVMPKYMISSNGCARTTRRCRRETGSSSAVSAIRWRRALRSTRSTPQA